jgi:chitinase
MNEVNPWLMVMVVCTIGSPVLAQDETTLQRTPFRVVGYLPDYRLKQIDPSTTARLTDVVFFSVTPEARGRFVSPALYAQTTTALLKQLREKYGVKVHLCVGGWNRSQGFAEIAASSQSRKQFAEGLTAYCRLHEFAGADLDWEHPANERESTDYGLLLSEIASRFRNHKLQLSIAMAAWQTLTAEGIKAVDAVHLMSYDADGEHSTIEQSQADINRLKQAGVPPEKILLGLPFYGRGITDRNLTKTYAEIVSTGKPTDADVMDGLYFNGPTTIRNKTRLAMDQGLGGIMIWEIGQDAPGEKSLLKVIESERNRRN